MAADLHHALVLHGDATDEDLLESEGIVGFDEQIISFLAQYRAKSRRPPFLAALGDNKECMIAGVLTG